MATPDGQRRLSAILFTDAVGSSRVTGADEREGLRLRDRHRALVRGAVERYGGRLIETPGDETLSTFESALDAVSAALAIREALRAEPDLALHTGVHVGETLFRGGEVFGDGVNIAARIRQLAPPGEILVSGEVAYAIRNHPEIEASPRGEHKLRNVDRPVTLFAVTGTPLPPAATSRAQRPLRSIPRSRLLLAGGALLVLSAVALQLARGRGATSAVAPLHPGAGIVAVMPFSVRGGDDLAYLREGMVELVSSKLAVSDEIRPVDPHALLAYVSRELDGEVTPETAAAAARHFGAAHFVLGSAVQVADRLHLEASLYAAGAAEEPLRRVALEQPAQDLLGLVDGVATGLMKDLVRNIGRFDRLEGATTHSPEALRAYLEGNAALRGWRNDEAAASFERAVALDPEFALAWYRLAFAEFSSPAPTRNPARGFEASDRALALADRIPRREAHLLRAYADTLDGRLSEAEARYRRLTREAPEDWEAWHGLGELLVHYNAYRGRSILESVEPFERALALDPNQPSQRAHLFACALTLGDLERARAQAEWLAANASDFGAQPQLWLAKESGSDEAMAAALARVEAEGATSVLGAFRVAPALREELLDMIRRSQPESMALARAFYSSVDARAGRLAAFRASGVERARYLGKDVDSLFNFAEAYLDAFPDIPASPDELSEQLVVLRSMKVTQKSSPLAEARRAYFVGLLSARLSQAGGVDASLRELERLATPPRGIPEAAELGISLRGYVAWQRQDPTETLRLLEALPKRPLSRDPGGLAGVGARVLDRFLIGLALESTGDLERAVGYHEFHVLEQSAGESLLDGPRALRRARLYETLGRQGEAIADYETVIAVWADCDPELRPRVEEARARVAALRAASSPTAAPGAQPAGAPPADGARSQLRQ